MSFQAHALAICKPGSVTTPVQTHHASHWNNMHDPFPQEGAEISVALSTLVHAAQHGDMAAFGCLVERFQRMACAVAYSVVGDVHLAEDAAQEAFIEAYQCLGALREPTAFANWFRLVVRKRADRLVRGKQLDLLPLSAADAMPTSSPEPSQLAELHELQAQVQRAIAALDEQERLLVSLFHLAGYSQREVAAIVELPEPVVKKRLFRARQRLRQHLEALVEIEFRHELTAQGQFARVVQFFAAVRSSDVAAVRRLLAATPTLVSEHERWDEGLAERQRLPSLGAYTALHRAAALGAHELAQTLLEHGAAIEARTPNGQTPLHVAVLNDRMVVVSLLLEHGADPNGATDRGMTPLHWAVIRQRHAAIALLLAAGADNNLPDCEGRTAADWAMIQGQRSTRYLQIEVILGRVLPQEEDNVRGSVRMWGWSAGPGDRCGRDAARHGWAAGRCGLEDLAW
ncbi:sigma-70 family RNA polymerase sigma factor [Candidatus Gracilibacteria bacterium]|nr:sigma-70 family RNA polymerase sigma factor [Candidatus Gracilibacteria bacterium]